MRLTAVTETREPGDGSDRQGLLVLFGGPAGAGKSTLASAWCATRRRSVRIDLDAVREMIVAGRADPQEPNQVQAEQYRLSVRACAALARVFREGSYDVAIDDSFEPEPFESEWRPLLAGTDWRLVILVPSLAETLDRSRRRTKRVLEKHTRDQHAASLRWPAERRVDTTGLSVEASLTLVRMATDT